MFQLNTLPHQNLQTGVEERGGAIKKRAYVDYLIFESDYLSVRKCLMLKILVLVYLAQCHNPAQTSSSVPVKFPFCLILFYHLLVNLFYPHCVSHLFVTDTHYVGFY